MYSVCKITLCFVPDCAAGPPGGFIKLDCIKDPHSIDNVSEYLGGMHLHVIALCERPVSIDIYLFITYMYEYMSK